MRSPSFVSGTTVWAATLCSGVEISSFGDVRDPHAGDACPQRLPPRRTPAPRSSDCPRFALTRPAAPPCPPAWPRQYIVSMRSQAAGHGKISSRCVPKLPAMARYRPDAFTKGSRTRKTPVRGNILPACIQIQLILARYACYVSKKPRKVPLGNTPREHLATKGHFRRPKPSNHAWRTNLAIL